MLWHLVKVQSCGSQQVFSQNLLSSGKHDSSAFVSRVLSNVIVIVSLAPPDVRWLPQCHASHLQTASRYKVRGSCAVTLPGSQGHFPGRPMVTFPFVCLLCSLLIFIVMRFNGYTACLWLMSLSSWFFPSLVLLDRCLDFGFGLFQSVF